MAGILLIIGCGSPVTRADVVGSYVGYVLPDDYDYTLVLKPDGTLEEFLLLRRGTTYTNSASYHNLGKWTFKPTGKHTQVDLNHAIVWPQPDLQHYTQAPFPPGLGTPEKWSFNVRKTFGGHVVLEDSRATPDGTIILKKRI